MDLRPLVRNQWYISDISRKSYEAAIYAVGATVMASKTNDFALVRPPGHHSHPDKPGGFCIFNNIAIAAKNLVNRGKNVFILDFDGHLGDGTEKCFYNTNKVLYFSLHQYPAFPGGGTVDMSEIYHPIYDWWPKANLSGEYGKFLSMLKNHQH